MGEIYTYLGAGRCPECGQNAWGKPDTLLIRGACYEDGEGEIVPMLADPSDEG